ncbi:toll/interleukin-1 receptor domain-containing protein [Actinoplanes sp. NPDC051411]|uniref:toll/interleukin-1 receptor domain-containing protein n=1 Tax=Actinoplanes sp. NPDC051411 TaxID=3155522 RepID=UPI00342575CA
MPADDAPEYDFFVSFTRSDQQWAEWIADQLARRTRPDGSPCRLLFQSWDFVPGVNWISMTHQGVQQSARVVPVLSPAYVQDSPYGAAEWQAVWRTDPNGVRRSVIPIRVEACDPAGLLGAVIYIDLVGRDERDAAEVLRREMDAAVDGRRPRTAPPRFPHPRAAGPAGSEA